MKKTLLSIYVMLLFVSTGFSQDSCFTAIEYCSGNVVTDSVSTGIAAPIGPDYGCLLSQNSPYWFYFHCTTSGNMQISVSSTGTAGSTSSDIDFIVWGPYTSLSVTCDSLTSSYILDCDYTTGALDTIDITSASAGSYYMIMLSNYADYPTSITYNQISGPGQASCLTSVVSKTSTCGKLDVFPNPTDNGIVNILFEDKNLKAITMELVDILGRTVYKEDVDTFSGTYKKKLIINSYQKGIYFVQIRGADGVVTKKIIYN